MEILHNIVHHSKASKVYIKLSVEDNYLNLNIKDDGTGFVYVENEVTGNGLMNLKQRTSAFFGKFSLECKPAKELTVHVFYQIKHKKVTRLYKIRLHEGSWIKNQNK
jgi:signal transduction histidine kinase